jgi:hypothetical protein
MFALGFLTGVVGTFVMFVFATWKQPQIQQFIEEVEDTFAEPGGFVDGLDKNTKTKREVEDILR